MEGLVMLKVSICGDCVYMDANGWDDETCGPMPIPFPMGWLEGFIISSNDADHNCGHFSHDRCDGCGTPDAGTRYCYLATMEEN